MVNVVYNKERAPNAVTGKRVTGEATSLRRANGKTSPSRSGREWPSC